MATEKQIEANRRNALRSTGPKTREGKEAVKFNALKHGLTADTLVLPDEDAEAFAERVDAWTCDLSPRDEVEAALVRRAASLSWRLDRADLHEIAALTRRVRDQAEVDRAAQRERVRSRLAKLLPTVDEFRRDGFDSSPPVELLGIVETSAEGCGWLIGCWGQIRQAIDRRRAWTHNDVMAIVRLSGHGGTSIDNPEALDLIVASRLIMRPLGALTADHWHVGPFALNLDPHKLAEACERQPRNTDEAASVLRAAAERALARLEILRKIRDREGDAWGAVESARIASFDTSDKGERLRRYQATTHRDMLRTLETISRLRLQSARLAQVEQAQESNLRNKANAEAPAGRETSPLPETPAPRPEPIATPTEPDVSPEPIGTAHPRNKANPNLHDHDEATASWIDIPPLMIGKTHTETRPSVTATSRARHQRKQRPRWR